MRGENDRRMRQEDIAGQLSELATKLLEAHEHILEPSWADFLRTYCAIRFRTIDKSSHEDRPTDSSGCIEKHIAHWAAYKTAHSDFKVRVLSVVPEVDEGCKRAVVWATTRSTALEDERVFTRESVTEMQFEYSRKRGNWTWSKSTCMRGHSDCHDMPEEP
ncbi:hypothetical protein LTR15_002858 [Elasticomyces elasticus]|nr:hypothetical protein LTR15_002858 [Elasticomyces elasticus]